MPPTSSPWRLPFGHVLVALAYLVSGWIGLRLATVEANITVVWPSTGIAIAVLVVGGWRWWPGVALGAMGVNLFVGMPPAEESPTFAMFALPSGTALGLWSSSTIAPPVGVAPGSSELCFVEDDVDAVHASWVARGIPIAQEPTDMDFGRTFVALDPDGHRLRVFRPGPDEAHG